MAMTERISRWRHADLARGVEPGRHHPVERSGIEYEIRMLGRNDVGLAPAYAHAEGAGSPSPNSEDARRGLRGDRL